MMRFAILLLLAGCATTGGNGWTGFDDGDLASWVERVAAPQMGEALSTHPRFRAEPIRVAVMTGASVAVRSDALSVQVRDELHARLLAVHGLDLSVHDAPALCDTPADGYLLGFELTRNGAHHAQAQLRLYDVVERRWVSGFQARWNGQLTAGERRLAERVAISESARGTRELPFNSDQSDLLAAYLATALACELRRRGDDEKIIAPATHRSAALVAGNLAAAHSSVIASAGDFALDTRVHEVDRGLYQVWAVLTATDSVSRSYTSNAYASAPLLRRPTGRNDRSELVATTARAPTPVVSNAVVVAPAPGGHCRAAVLPSTAHRPDRHVRIDAGECFAIEFDADPAAKLYVVSRDAGGDYVRIFPADCKPGGMVKAAPARHRFPARGQIDWDRRGGEETFLIVGATQAAAPRIAAAMSQLPSACERRGRAAGVAWRRQLDALLQRYASQAGVATLRVQHTAAGLAQRYRD